MRGKQNEENTQSDEAWPFNGRTPQRMGNRRIGVRPVAHGRECALDGVRRAQMLPVLCWEVVEGEQSFAKRNPLT
jgi:hypothetical protein